MAIAEELAALRERTLAEIEAACDSTALEAVRVAVHQISLHIQFHRVL